MWKTAKTLTRKNIQQESYLQEEEREEEEEEQEGVKGGDNIDRAKSIGNLISLSRLRVNLPFHVTQRYEQFYYSPIISKVAEEFNRIYFYFIY